ncbi:hypothetical protein IPC632_24830 [Pseudomonas aeruginosa]|uniref:hypothetical protein n=1 Tax=Pseudomonas aeruginosa TaxID=287 RepID=UPI0010683175|nr:hypothetical protein [Pseudomonas aeruginosa]TEI44613.1 hypothetical protein IPC634_25970 [Pseudomonas aeruginosa]TEI48699.1 hypothetical protein IPC632_24830 [Pseudomonas aeruginosa]TEI61961.1 hypothetical protein IPC633_20110 [Pseudomonas aeruginosa]TEJ03730.1 hypothetical protein IPC621_22150 [Pseudomonas aeruginosa]
MAYQTGVASGLADLISALQTFCAANGFTVGPSWTFSSGSGTTLTNWQVRSLVKNGVYFTMHYGVSGGSAYSRDVLLMNTSTAVSSSGDPNTQVGACPANCRTDMLGGPYVGYHFFSDGYGVNVAVEVVTNVFVHFNFGELQKNGAWTGSQYVMGTALYTRSGSGPYDLFDSYNFIPFFNGNIGDAFSDYGSLGGHIRTPIGDPTAYCRRAFTSTTSFWTPLADNHGRQLVDCSPNSQNGRSVIVPANALVASSGQSGPFYQLGYVANAGAINITNLNPKEVVNTDWMVFPIQQKNGPSTNYINSQNYGLAYRK